MQIGQLTEDSIVGTWDISASESDITNRSEVQDVVVEARSTSEIVESEATLTFNADGTFVTAGNYDIRATTITAGTTNEDVIAVNLDGQRGTWSLSGQTLMVSGVGGSVNPSTGQVNMTAIEGQEVDILEFVAGQRLRYEQSIDITQTFPGFGSTSVKGFQRVTLTQ